MTKQSEKKYFDLIGDDGISFTVRKPNSDRQSAGCLMHNIGAIASIMRNEYGLKDLEIIDLGCGSGWTSNQFALMGHEVVGVDIAKGAIGVAKKTFSLPNLKYEAVDYDELKRRYREKFDVVIFHDSLHHSDDPTNTMTSALATLKEGGICIVCEPGKGHSKSRDAIEAVEKYGVTEADMPASRVVECAKNAGFRKYKIYSSPSLMHRALYWEYEGRFSILKNDFIRLLAVNLSYVLKRNKEGIVVLHR